MIDKLIESVFPRELSNISLCDVQRCARSQITPSTIEWDRGFLRHIHVLPFGTNHHLGYKLRPLAEEHFPTSVPPPTTCARPSL